jgi:phosphoglycerate dehydrogenase-like enzyme
MRAEQGVVVAGPPGIDSALQRLSASGHIGFPVQALVIEAGSGPRAGSGPHGGAEPSLPDPGPSQPVPRHEGVRVLWRRGPAPRGWIHRAVAALPDLAWMHSDFVGMDTVPLEELAARHVVVTNGVGNYSRPMAEWVVLAMLAAAKRLAHFVRQSDAGIWDPTPHLDELEGSTALFLGLGSVGALAAPMAAALGVQVVGVARTPRPQPPPGVARLVARDQWRSELPRSDFVVCALPLTKQTAGMIDAAALSAMKPTAWLINVARGGLIDEDALVKGLDAGEIAGAVLDAFVKEPLPPGHPLWGRPNVLVVPHYTWASPRIMARKDALFADQLRAWVEGRPLANRVDLVAGY